VPRSPLRSQTRCADCKAAKKARFGGDDAGYGGGGRGGGRGFGGGRGGGGRGGFGGGGGEGCFKCGSSDHWSRECPTGGAGGGGGRGFGGGRGGGRGDGGRGGGGGGACYAFQKGSCKFGDSCRFSHA